MVTITLGVLTTTTEQVPGRAVREYLGIVGADAIVPPAGFPGGSRHARRLSLQAARERAIATLARRASRRGATVVLGVKVEYVSIGIGNLLVTATGTAARL